MAEFQHLNREATRIWDANADFWNARMGEGNDFHKQLVEPSQLRLLGSVVGDRVLDVACGNGQFARKLAELGATVVGIDAAEGMVRNARECATPGPGSAEYRVVDATDEGALLALGVGSFDAAVCTMAIMDMASVGPLAQALTRLLRLGGRLVFSVMHPCFNSPAIKMSAEVEDKEGNLVEDFSIKVGRYATPYTAKGLAMVGQPEAQHYFHRSITTLYGVFFAAGFVLDGVDEPCFNQPGTGSTVISWANFTDIPPVLVSRMRLVQTEA